MPQNHNETTIACQEKRKILDPACCNWKSGTSRPRHFGNLAGPGQEKLVAVFPINHLSLLMQNIHLMKKNSCVNLLQFVAFIAIIILIINRKKIGKSVYSCSSLSSFLYKVLLATCKMIFHFGHEAFLQACRHSS